MAHNGFKIKKINPIPEAMPWIFPETLSWDPLGSSGKIPAIIEPIPNAIIPHQ
jgi:hypothetical protein